MSKRIAKFIAFKIGLLVFFLLKLLRAIVRIRVGCLIYNRIGHLSANTELYLRRRLSDKTKAKEYHIFISGEPANHQLLKMIRRQVPVIKNRGVLWTYNTVRSFIGDSDLWMDPPVLQNYYYEFDNLPAQLTFTRQEEMKGKALLEDMGIGPGTPFVCFNARDKAYLDKKNPSNLPEDWSYHNYRDCDVRNYLPAARYLASLGIFVIRMGYVVEKKLEIDNPRIIDYATHYRSDFGDIYLTAKCKFFLASEGGLGSVAWTFNVPVAYSNSAPVAGRAGWRKTNLFTSKKLWSQEKKRFLTFPEVIACGADNWCRSEQYKQAGIEIIENTPEEILGLVEEMNARIDGTWITGEEDEDLQRRYWKIYTPGHRCYNSPSRIGAKFLRQNKELLKQSG